MGEIKDVIMNPLTCDIQVGIDIVSVSRIEEAARRSASFLKRNFSADEVSYCESFRSPWEHLAGRFAAKEAVAKALGIALRTSEIEVLNEKDGRPTVRLSGKTKDWHQGKKILLSISHEGGYAVAFCIAINAQC